MESEGAVEIFARSVEARNLIYIKNMSEMGRAKFIPQLGIACYTAPLFTL